MTKPVQPIYLGRAQNEVAEQITADTEADYYQPPPPGPLTLDEIIAAIRHCTEGADIDALQAVMLGPYAVEIKTRLRDGNWRIDIINRTDLEA